ncbi:MAG: DNA polymerase III subunit delta [Acutalibacteraceae bacterium]
MPKINHIKLKSDLTKKIFYNLYYLTGETYFVSEFKNAISEEIIGNSKNDFNFLNISSEAIEIEKLEDAINTYPIGSSKKCIILNNIPFTSWDKSEFEKFISIIEDLPEFVCVIIAQTEKLTDTKASAKSKKIQKLAEKTGCLADFSIDDVSIEDQLIEWANNDFGKVLSNHVALKIKKNCELHSLFELKNELKKICEFEKTDAITEETVDSVICKSYEKKKVFALPKLILSKDAPKAAQMLEDLLAQGEEPILLVSVIAGEYIDMFRVKALQNQGISTSALLEIFDYKSKEFRIKNAERNSKRYSMKTIKKCLKLLIEADIKLKSTQNSPKFVITELIARLLRV